MSQLKVKDFKNKHSAQFVAVKSTDTNHIRFVRRLMDDAIFILSRNYRLKNNEVQSISICHFHSNLKSVSVDTWEDTFTEYTEPRWVGFTIMDINDLNVIQN